MAASAISPANEGRVNPSAGQLAQAASPARPRPLPHSAADMQDAELQTVGTASVAAEPSQPPPPPTNKEKLRPVVICASACMTMVMSTGLCFAFGVYQDLYQAMADEEGNPFSGASPAAIDLIGTLSVAFMTIGAPFSTALTKRFSPRIIIGSGGLLFFITCLLASFSEKLWQFQLTQGFLIGWATCLSFLPAVTVSPTHFGARRGLALGIITSGTGIGGVIWGPVLEALNAHFGFRAGLRIAGGTSGACIVIAGLFLDWDAAAKERFRQEEAATGRPISLVKVPFVPWRTAKTNKFIAQALAATLQGAAYYTPIFFFSAYARTLGYSTSAGANFIALSNACNAIGKIALGLVADRFGSINTLLATTAISAMASVCFWLPSSLLQSKPLFLAYTVFYGVFASSYVSLFPSVVLQVFGPAQFPGVYSTMYQMRGLATFVGTPVAGALIRSGNQTGSESYWPAISLVVVLLSTATAGMGWVRVEATKGPNNGWKQ